MMTKLILICICAVAMATAVLGSDDPCPCPNMNFDVIRWVKAPGAQDKIFSIMQKKYQSAFHILKKALAADSIQTLNRDVDLSNFVMDTNAKCMHGIVKDGVFRIGGKNYEVDLEVRGFALPRGVSTAICNCKQKNFQSGDVDVCNEYLRIETESRMNEVACKFQ